MESGVSPFLLLSSGTVFTTSTVGKQELAGVPNSIRYLDDNRMLQYDTKRRQIEYSLSLLMQHLIMTILVEKCIRFLNSK